MKILAAALPPEWGGSASDLTRSDSARGGGWAVVATSRRAAVLRRREELVVVEGSGGYRLPNGVVAADADLAALSVGDELVLGRPARWFDPSIAGGPVAPAAVQLLADRPEPEDRLGLVSRLAGDGPASVLGLGEGSTPAGDDLLGGLMLGWHLADRPDLARGTLADLDLRRTAPLSADLLVHAAAGRAAAPVVALARALRAGHGLVAALDEVAALGGTSGEWTLTGLRSVLTSEPADLWETPVA